MLAFDLYAFGIDARRETDRRAECVRLTSDSQPRGCRLDVERNLLVLGGLGAAIDGVGNLNPASLRLRQLAQRLDCF